MTKIKTAVFSVLLFIPFLSLSQTEDLYKSESIPTELKNKVNAVVRLNQLDVTIDAQDDLSMVHKRIVTVLNEKGNAVVGAISGYDKYNKIRRIEAKIFNAEGKEIKKFKKKDFIDRSAVDGGTLYSDSRVMFMGYMPVDYPYTVEFSCEIESSNTAAIPTWRPINNYYVGVEKDRYTLTDNANLGLRFKEKNLRDYNITKNNSPTSLQLTLEMASPIVPEQLSPSYHKLFPQVLVAVENFSFYGVEGQAKNWLEFGNWMNNALLEGRNQVTEATKSEILKLTENYQDPLAKAKAVFEYVQENTRYISVQVGIGGVQPISALEVDELKYGDCKGLTNYTQALLEIAGVESYYSIVEAGNEIVDLEDDFASLEQGNHIILAIPTEQDMVWLDCTSQLHPFDFIGDFTDSRNVLVIKPDASEIIKTKVYPDSLNYQYTHAQIKLDPTGNLQSTINRKTKGLQYDNRFYLERQSNDDIIEYYKEYWDYVNNLEVLKYDFNNNKIDVVFNETIEVFAGNYGTLTGDRLLFKPNIFNQNTYVPKRYRNRKMPIEIARGYLDEDSFEIELPEGYEVEALPNDVLVETKFGKYQLKLKNNGDSISCTRKLFIKKGEYPSTDYKSYRDFRKQVSKGDNSKIVLKLIS
ncbi:DUF3857 domain-containing protein [Winogradskyella sp.]|uniref:DUF3857 domain-containing protein n=1 Tax=Winogradskyella sp. TaxID=1883156 RepID=UPI003BAB7D66